MHNQLNELYLSLVERFEIGQAPISIRLVLDGSSHHATFGDETSYFAGSYVARLFVDGEQIYEQEYVEKDGATDRKDNAWDKLVEDLLDTVSNDFFLSELRGALCYNHQVLAIIYDGETPDGRIENCSPSHELARRIRDEVADPEKREKMLDLLEATCGFVDLGQVGARKIWDID